MNPLSPMEISSAEGAFCCFFFFFHKKILVLIFPGRVFLKSCKYKIEKDSQEQYDYKYFCYQQISPFP